MRGETPLSAKPSHRMTSYSSASDNGPCKNVHTRRSRLDYPRRERCELRSHWPQVHPLRFGLCNSGVRPSMCKQQLRFPIVIIGSKNGRCHRLTSHIIDCWVASRNIRRHNNKIMTLAAPTHGTKFPSSPFNHSLHIFWQKYFDSISFDCIFSSFSIFDTRSKWYILNLRNYKFCRPDICKCVHIYLDTAGYFPERSLAWAFSLRYFR